MTSHGLGPGFLPWSSYSDHPFPTLAPWDPIPSTAPYSQSFEPSTQASDLWATSDLPTADTDWSLVSADHLTPYPSVLDGVDASVSEIDYAFPPIFPRLSDPGSSDPQTLLSISLAASSANSQGEIA